MFDVRSLIHSRTQLDLDLSYSNCIGVSYVPSNHPHVCLFGLQKNYKRKPIPSFRSCPSIPHRRHTYSWSHQPLIAWQPSRCLRLSLGPGHLRVMGFAPDQFLHSLVLVADRWPDGWGVLRDCRRRHVLLPFNLPSLYFWPRSLWLIRSEQRGTKWNSRGMHST